MNELRSELKAFFDEQCTQQEFGDMVGISQQAVSDLVRRGVIFPGQTRKQWMDRYLTHLREVIIARQFGG